MQLLHLVAILCCLATGFTAPTTASIKWCVISDQELQKCQDLAQRSPVFTCDKRSLSACIDAIKTGEADAITLSGENIYQAGLRNKDLAPIIAEEYTSEANPCTYSVAVVKKGTMFGLDDLKGKKSCHSGLTSEGWTFPIGTLISRGSIMWEGSTTKPRLEAVSEFFSASCVPGAGTEKLCQLCKGGCSASSANDYYGDDGALKCLAEDAGDVAFMNPTHIPASDNYELLCQNNKRAPVAEYKTCNLGKQAAHAVVTRKDADEDLVNSIYTSLTTVRGINLFSSEFYGGKNLMFSDSTAQLQRVPPGTDSFLYLGAEYFDKLRSFHRETAPSATGIRWCAVGHAETGKCDQWSSNIPDDSFECQSAASVEECLKKIMRKEADAIAVDGGEVYTAGQCGLVPVMVEQYDEGKCSSNVNVAGGTSASSYHAVAVIKRGSGVTWGNLQGKRSCHTGMGRTAGWNIPMGVIRNETGSCEFDKFFRSGCAPGADPSSVFCTNCKGSKTPVGGEDFKCKASAAEQYYGYAGAFRCLVDDAGDVAFIKHTIVTENTNGNGPEWAKELRSEDFELICPTQAGSVPVSGYTSCKLAVVPAHAVVTRPDMRSEVVQMLNDHQNKFGPNGNSEFKMFQSSEGKNLLFKDSTKCLQEIQSDSSYETFLGQDYMTSVRSLRKCSDNTPALEKSCAFRSCQ